MNRENVKSPAEQKSNWISKIQFSISLWIKKNLEVQFKHNILKFQFWIYG